MIREIKSNKIQGKEIADGRYEIKKPKSQRSLQLNKYYWKVVIGIFAGELGWSVEDAHDYFKDIFLFSTKELPRNDVYWSGKLIRKIKSTTDLSNQEFIQYIKQIQMFSAQQGIVIPDPNEADYDAIYKMYKLD